MAKLVLALLLSAVAPKAYAQESRPSRPPVLAARGLVSESTLRDLGMAGLRYCKGLYDALNDTVRIPSCDLGKTRAFYATREVCRGMRWEGFDGFTDFETVVVNLDYLQVLSTSVARYLAACGHPHARSLAEVQGTIQKTWAEFFRLEPVASGGEFQSIAYLATLEWGEFLRIRHGWRRYALDLHRYLETN